MVFNKAIQRHSLISDLIEKFEGCVFYWNFDNEMAMDFISTQNNIRSLEIERGFLAIHSVSVRSLNDTEYSRKANWDSET